MYWSLQKQGPYQSPGPQDALLEEEEGEEEEEEEEEDGEEEDFEGGIEDGVSNLTTWAERTSQAATTTDQGLSKLKGEGRSNCSCKGESFG